MFLAKTAFLSSSRYVLQYFLAVYSSTSFWSLKLPSINHRHLEAEDKTPTFLPPPSLSLAEARSERVGGKTFLNVLLSPPPLFVLLLRLPFLSLPLPVTCSTKRKWASVFLQPACVESKEEETSSADGEKEGEGDAQESLFPHPSLFPPPPLPEMERNQEAGRRHAHTRISSA